MTTVEETPQAHLFPRIVGDEWTLLEMRELSINETTFYLVGGGGLNRLTTITTGTSLTPLRRAVTDLVVQVNEWCDSQEDKAIAEK